MADTRSRRGELIRAEGTEVDWQRQLEIDKQMVDQETLLRHIGLLRRLCLMWLLLGNLILVGLLILVNFLLIRYYHGEYGYRAPTNAWGTIAILVSICAASYLTFLKHQDFVGEQGTLAKLKEEKKLLLASGSVGVAGTQRRYKEEIRSFISDYREESGRYRRTHNLLQAVIIVGSITTTSVTSAIGQEASFKWIAVCLSISVGIAAGFIGYFKFRERAMNLRQTADAIEQEFNAAELGIRRYKDLGQDQALTILAEEVEWLREEQRKREQQLEQPPEARTTQS